MAEAVRCDVLIIGSGIAGLTCAIEAAAFGDVVLITKRAREESNTRYAQGGIAAVLGADDSFEAHVKDTLTAGAGLCHERAVEVCVREGPGRIADLLRRGVRFDSHPPVEGGPDGLDLTLEGGHSARRVAHASDMTGQEVSRALIAAAVALPNVRIYEDHTAVDLILAPKFGGPDRCAGAYVLDEKKGQVVTFLARETVLASGGAGKVYLYTTNPDVATG
ncbi:MAG TPA: FAD-binding protein, partial [Polyangiaceae bacterium]|nr:FAD-binding protein [Polyangiaceae bacterium]